MALTFELVTPERLERSERVHMVVVPGADGDFGVLEGHAPLLSTLREDAELAVYASEGAAPEVLRLDGGFAEVTQGGLTVLAERVG